ncbi:PREDICTED: protein xmas-2 [Drosophila arizonae]|uniref:Protein xmas-2 n=1 Tax=Drosophila arizonae TaxID=7263 RepID=A0ABM1PWE0_DROAR|nr:PREDICTED: protein xmas-2 [Drosophila arizonae]
MTDAHSGTAYNNKTLLCTNIPELFLDKFVARTHFSRFGNLVNFVLRPRRMTCTVSYSNEEEAALALREGNVYNGHEFDMSYAENESTPAQKTEEWVDPDVQAELSVLSGTWRNEYGSSKPNATKPQTMTTATSLFGSSKIASAATSGNAEREREKDRERERQRAPAQFKIAKQELEAVMRKPAYTSEEKYRVLDARDKLLRLNQKRSTTDAQRLQGHCPDMCPEKERVLREFQRQVAIYELKPGTDDQIAHELALKQYSRSSADQETPLPHELRAEPVLHMTMSYLMHEIMDISETTDNLGDWFHFVWDRTRSIRKEITQQELCSLSAVKLVEQCARFHIHCAARLVAEDPSVFDAKINAENLTKCLQTLKYMYHDLRLKGIQCPREPEFRGYIVLLNLADANFLWDISQLPVELQNCKEIRRAIQFHLALQDTNFVRFFQLLREPETSYLSACILITYFIRLRILAMHRIVQAYRAPRKYEFTLLPVQYIRQMLLFASDEETIEFVEGCGLTVNQADRVELTRIHTPEHYKLSRQFELVESKRNQSVGECICGEELPPKSLYSNHRPHNSFNEQGYLKSSAWTARDQLPNAEEEEEEPRAAYTETMPTAATATATTAATTTTFKSPTSTDNLFKVPLFSAPISPRIKPATPPSQAPQPQPQPTMPANIFGFEMPQKQQQQQQQQQQAFGFGRNTAEAAKPSTSTAIGFSFAAAAAASMAKDGPSAADLAEQQRQQKAADEAKFAALQQAIATAKQREQELLELQKAKAEQAERARQQRLFEQQQAQERQKREEQAQQAAAAAAAEAEAKAERQRQRRVEAERTTQRNHLLDQLIDEQLNELCKREFRLHHSALAIYDALLDEQIVELVKRNIRRTDYELGLMRQYWRRWRNYRRVQQQKDALFACLPLSFGAESSERLLNTKTAEQPLRLMRRYRQGEACDYRQLLAGMDDQCWLKLDLWELLAHTLQQETPGARQYFKLLISLPDSSVGLVMEHALDRGVLQQPIQSEGQSQRAKAPGQPAYITGLAHGVALCVHKLKGMPPSNPNQMRNADGIICFVDVKQVPEARQRLHSLVKSSGCDYVAVIVQQQQTEEAQLAVQLQLETLRAFRIFDCRTMARGKQKLQLVALLQCAVQFLAKQPHRSRGSLQQMELREWVLRHLGDELFERLRYASLKDVAIGWRCRQVPQFCVQLYNEAVRRLQLVAGEQLDDRPQLPQELRDYVEPLPPQAPLPNRLEYFVSGWQSREQRAKIVQLLEQAKLPEMPPLPATSNKSQDALCEWLLNYAQLSEDDAQVETVALRAIQTLELQLRTGSPNYLDIVDIFAKERLYVVLQRNAASIPAAIVYRRHTMQRYFATHWYYDWPSPEEAAAAAAAAAAESPQQEESIEEATALAPQQEPLDYEQVLRKAQAVLDKCQQHHPVERKTLTVLNEPLDTLDRIMERCERHTLNVPHEPHSNWQSRRQAENLPMPVNKRQRLNAPASDECADLLDRTERLLNVSQTAEERRLQILQRANRFL